jgi:ABC-type amino acid transport system permease subunit
VIGGQATNAVLAFVVDVVRMVPLLVQLLIWYLGLNAFGIRLDPFAASVIALSVNASGFISEIIRGAVLAVSRGQREAALSVGLTPAFSVLNIEMPQAIPAITPALIGYYIGLIKDTSIAYIVGLLELTRTGSFIANEHFRPIETFLVVAAIYFALCFPLARIVPIIDARMRRTGLAQEKLFV